MSFDTNKTRSFSDNTVFLNLLEHGGKKYIRFWYKANPFISSKLKEAPWVKFSKTYKCFVMHHTPQDIERTYGLFRGLALVLAGQQAEPLAKVPVVPVVRLQPLVTAEGTVVSITFRYSKEIYNCLKDSLVARWNPEQ